MAIPTPAGKATRYGSRTLVPVAPADAEGSAWWCPRELKQSCISGVDERFTRMTGQQPVSSAERGFREIWSVAREEGRKQQESVIAGLAENINAFKAENQRLDGAVVSARNEAEAARHARQEAEAALDKVNSHLAESQAALIRSGQEMQDALRKLAEEQVAHRKTQEDLQAAIQRGHEHQLEAVKCRALLDAENGRGKKSRLQTKGSPES